MLILIKDIESGWQVEIVGPDRRRIWAGTTLGDVLQYLAQLETLLKTQTGERA